MDTTNSDNSELTVIKNVEPKKIEEMLNENGYTNLGVAGIFCMVDERMQSLDTISPNVGEGVSGVNTATDTTANASSNTSTTSSGTSKANIEFGNDGIAFITDLLREGQIAELKLIDPNKAKETRKPVEKDKGARE